MKDSAWLLEKLRDPASLERSDQAELREIIAEYPYFSLPYLLLARQMHQYGHAAYESLLPVISLRAQNRKKLFRLVHELEGQSSVRQQESRIEDKPKREETVAEKEMAPEVQPESTTDHTDANEAGTPQIENDKDLNGGEPEIEKEKEEIPETSGESREVEDKTDRISEEEPTPTTRFVLESTDIEHESEEESAEADHEIKEIPFGRVRSGMESEKENLSVKTVEESEEADPEEEPDSNSAEEVRAVQEVKDTEVASVEETNEQKIVPEGLTEEEEKQTEPVSVASSDIQDIPVAEETAKVDESEIGNFFSWLDKYDHLKEEHEKQHEQAEEIRDSNDGKDEVEASANAPIQDQLNIIDEFIEKQPSVSRVQGKFFDPAAYAKESERLQDDMVTETIAKIFVQQEKYEKALEAYEKLQLKYPKKKAYFAALISEINEKIK